MARNVSFKPDREPFAGNNQVTGTHVRGPLSFLNPTQAYLEHSKNAQTSGGEDADSAAPSLPSGIRYRWRSRDNRKGRHALLIDQTELDKSEHQIIIPQRTSHPSQVLRKIGRMFTHYPVWDISWLVAYIFTWGSVVWCINGLFSFLPYIRPDLTFDKEVLYGGGITAFIGAVLFFEIGSILLMFEAVNANREGCFGWAVEHLVGENSDTNTAQLQICPDLRNCAHHHQNKKNFVGKGVSATERAKEEKSWQWFPTLVELRSHYFHELGFLASLSQFCGATIFGIAGVTALPGINNNMSQPLTDGIYWAPQIVGGTGFIISGTLYMLETQKHWYTPSFGVLGWHIAFWNLIGGIGFTLCGALGPAVESYGAQYQASCATFWGGFAFLIGSLLQLYESLDKNPVEVVES